MIPHFPPSPPPCRWLDTLRQYNEEEDVTEDEGAAVIKVQKAPRRTPKRVRKTTQETVAEPEPEEVRVHELNPLEGGPLIGVKSPQGYPLLKAIYGGYNSTYSWWGAPYTSSEEGYFLFL